jgi:hypothetical protein
MTLIRKNFVSSQPDGSWGTIPQNQFQARVKNSKQVMDFKTEWIRARMETFNMD